jgi:hypothetical protein
LVRVCNCCAAFCSFANTRALRRGAIAKFSSNPAKRQIRLVVRQQRTNCRIAAACHLRFVNVVCVVGFRRIRPSSIQVAGENVMRRMILVLAVFGLGFATGCPADNPPAAPTTPDSPPAVDEPAETAPGDRAINNPANPVDPNTSGTAPQ